MGKEKKGLGKSEQAHTLRHSFARRRKQGSAPGAWVRAGEEVKPGIQLHPASERVCPRPLWIPMQVMQLAGKVGEGI